MEEKIINNILPCLNADMIITDDAVTDIIIDCKVTEPFAGGLHTVAAWFNAQNVAKKTSGDQKRYVGALVNLLTLLASQDINALLNNWVLEDMTD